MNPYEKHMETARILCNIVGPTEWDLSVEQRERNRVARTQRIAAALARAERDGMKRAAEVCEVRAAQWDANVDGRIPAFLSSYRQRRMADEARTIQRMILSEAGEE